MCCRRSSLVRRRTTDERQTEPTVAECDDRPSIGRPSMNEARVTAHRGQPVRLTTVEALWMRRCVRPDLCHLVRTHAV